jgi:hypothetical protein
LPYFFTFFFLPIHISFSFSSSLPFHISSQLFFLPSVPYFFAYSLPSSYGYLCFLPSNTSSLPPFLSRYFLLSLSFVFSYQLHSTTCSFDNKCSLQTTTAATLAVVPLEATAHVSCAVTRADCSNKTKCKLSETKQNQMQRDPTWNFKHTEDLIPLRLWTTSTNKSSHIPSK